MYDFETLILEILKSRPELSREELLRRVAAKKETVGAGYLTDQGALFLVAGELGVGLQQTVASSDMALKDLYIGANDVTVAARVLTVYPVSRYGKKDGSEGKYRWLVLFDGGPPVRLTVWDEKVDEVEELGAGPDTPVRVVSAYVRQGFDGKPSLNLGKRGRITILPDAESSGLPPLSDVTEKLTKLEQERTFVALEVIVDSEPRYSEFVRSDGSQGSLYQFSASGDHGSPKTRVVVWSPTARPELKVGQKVVITNVKCKRSLTGEFEIHGDAGSVIAPGKRREPLRVRIAAITPGPAKTTLLAVDNTKKVWVLEAGQDAAPPVKGSLASVSADQESNGLLICRTAGAITAVEATDFPRLTDLTTKLRDTKKEKSRVMVEVIALSRGATDEFTQKDGSVIRRGELVVGDDTAETKVVGWREQSEKLLGIQPGERLRISGVCPKAMRAGGLMLELDAQSVVEKLWGLD